MAQPDIEPAAREEGPPRKPKGVWRGGALAGLGRLVHQRGMIDPAAPVLAVTGLARERRMAAGAGVEAVGAGGSPARLRLLLDAREVLGCRAVISFGIAGGLDPDLKPGDVVVGTGVVTEAGRRPADLDAAAALIGCLSGLASRVVSADVAGVDAAILGVEAKTALRTQTGAAAVDMESHVAAAFAGRHGLPFAILRVVCDPAGRALPAFAANALKPDGEPDLRAVLGALVLGRARIGDLVRLGRDASVAFAVLGRCRARLGPGLGIPAAVDPSASGQPPLRA